MSVKALSATQMTRVAASPVAAPVAARAARPRTVGPSIVDDVSAAGRRAAAARTAMSKQLAAHGTGSVLPEVDLTAPRDLQADSVAQAARRVDPAALTGNQIQEQAAAMRSDSGLLNSVRSGQNPLGPSWTDGSVAAQRENRPGKDILDAAARVREATPGLSSSIARGEGMLSEGSIRDLNTESMRQRLDGPTESNSPG